jgi:hypothetical protein
MLSHTGALFLGMDPDRVARHFAARQAALDPCSFTQWGSRHPVRTELEVVSSLLLLLAQRPQEFPV